VLDQHLLDQGCVLARMCAQTLREDLGMSEFGKRLDRDHGSIARGSSDAAGSASS